MSGAQASPRLRPPTTGRLFYLASLPGYLDLLVCCIERRILWEPNGMKYIVTRKMPPPVASVCSLLWYSLSHIKEVCRRNPSPRGQEVLHFLWPQCCVVWGVLEGWMEAAGVVFLSSAKRHEPRNGRLMPCVQLGSCPRRWCSGRCNLLAYRSESTMELNERIVPFSLSPPDDEMGLASVGFVELELTPRENWNGLCFSTLQQSVRRQWLPCRCLSACRESCA